MGFGRFVRRITRPITNIFRRRGEGDYNEVIEQTQKVEIQYRDPPPDKDYVKLNELTRMIVPYQLKGDITSVNSSYLLAHFGVSRTLNLTNEPRLKWTLFGYNYQARQTYYLKSLIGKNYDKSWLPDNNIGTLLYSSVMDRVGKIDDFKDLNDYPISTSWQSGVFECRRQFYVQSIGTSISVYSRVYKRIGHTSNTSQPVPPSPPKPQEVNVTINCIINSFQPNNNYIKMLYIRKNDNARYTKIYNPNNSVRINIRVPVGTVFNVNKLSYNSSLSPHSCPQFTCNRDETVTYTFNYRNRTNYYRLSHFYVTEYGDWVKYGSGQSTNNPFNFVYQEREAREHEDRDDWRGRSDRGDTRF